MSDIEQGVWCDIARHGRKGLVLDFATAWLVKKEEACQADSVFV